MTNQEFDEKLRTAINRLYEVDHELLAESYNINERTVTHRLAFHLNPKFSNFHVDCEYNRMIDPNGDITEGDYFAKTLNLVREDQPSAEDEEAKTVFPDVIIHKRKTRENLAVIEVKMKWKNAKKAFDFQKLKAYKKDLNYTFAVYLEFDEKSYKIEFI
jgi:hypothetical protein